jgi:hypothetical protein
MRALATKLAAGGKVFMRKPLRFISAEEVSRVMQQSGLGETHTKRTSIPTQGAVLEGIYRRPSGRGS